MGNTEFYRDVATSNRDLTWKEILSETKVKHSKAELEYAMTSGMAINTATEEDMLVKWHRPWVFKKLAVFGISFVLFLYFVYIVLAIIGGLIPAIEILSMVVPPVVIPLSLLVFLWELNIPKNISFIEVLSIFFIGGVLSLLASMFLFTFFVPAILSGEAAEAAWNAPFAEEPGKFVISLLFLSIYSKRNKKIYGLTGLVVGAAVGAGFAAFESIQYVFENSADLGSSISISIIRMAGAFGAHTLWCAIYTAAFALGCKKTKTFSFAGFGSGLTWLCFAFSFFTHMFGNMDWIVLFVSEDTSDGGILLALIIQEMAFTALEWFVFLKIIKKCLAQAVYSGTYYSGMGRSYETEIRMAGGNVNPQYNNPPMGMPMGRPIDIPHSPRPQMNPQFSNNPQMGAPMGRPMDIPRSPQPQVAPQQVPQGMPSQVAPQQVPQGMPSQVMPQPRADVFFSAPNVRVECVNGMLKGQSWMTGGKMSFVFGRGADSDVRFPGDAVSISRSHCKLFFANGVWKVADLNSKNGTIVNDIILAPGSEQIVGGTVKIVLAKSEETFIVNC